MMGGTNILIGVPAPAAVEWAWDLLWGVVAAGVLAVIVVTAVRRLTTDMTLPQAFWLNVTIVYCRWWFRLRRVGRCTVPRAGPVIVVANHTCSVDPLLLIASCSHRILGFLIAREFYDVPVGRLLIRMIECVPVRRDGHDAAGTRAAIRHLKAGKALGVFIEGRISRPGEVLDAKRGAALLATRTGAVVVPAHISGTVYDPGVTRSFFRRHRAVVRFGDPIDLGAYGSGKLDKEALVAVSELLLRRIRELAPGSEEGVSGG